MIVNFVCKNLDPLALKVPVLLKSTLRTIKCKHIRLSNRQAELFHGWWLNDYVQFQICWALCLTWIFKQMWLIIHVLLGLLKNQWIIGCPSTDQSGSSTCRKVLLMQFERPPVRSVGSTAWWIWLLAAMMIQLHLSKHGDLFNIFRINFWFFPRYLFLKKTTTNLSTTCWVFLANQWWLLSIKLWGTLMQQSMTESLGTNIRLSKSSWTFQSLPGIPYWALCHYMDGMAT